MKKIYKEKLLNILFATEVSEPVSQNELQALFLHFKIEIDFNLKNFKNHHLHYKYLRELQYEFNEVIEYQKILNFDDISESFEKKRRLSKSKNIQNQPKISHFPYFNHQVIRYVTLQIDVFNASQTLDAMSKPKFQSNLFWNLTKTKLVEYALLLFDNQAVINVNRPITQLDLINGLSALFNVNISDIYHKTRVSRDNKKTHGTIWCQNCVIYQQNITKTIDFKHNTVDISVN